MTTRMRRSTAQTAVVLSAGAGWQTVRYDRVRSEIRPSPLPAGWPGRVALEAGRSVRVRHPRRPLTPTGTNLLGLVKHLTVCEFEYFGDVFGRPPTGPPPWADEDPRDRDPNADMWAGADESRQYVIGWYQRAWAHADGTFDALDLDALGRVPWWGESGEVTLHEVMVHVIVDTQRHAGHADIIRELIDGAAGLLAGHENLPPGDQAWWAAHRSRVEQAARAAGTA